MAVSMKNLLGALAVAGLAACGPRVERFDVNIVTTACGGASSPMEEVTHFRVRVLGEGIAQPLEATSLIAAPDHSIKVPHIPAGSRRMVEVRAYAGDPAAGGRLVSIGRSVPFEVNAQSDGSADATRLNVFLRKVNGFSQPSSAGSPTACTKLSTPRVGHSATVLPDGKVLIAGGYQLSGKNPLALSSTELFDPDTGAFEPGPDLSHQGRALPRAFHTATLMKNNQVLVWGGETYSLDPSDAVKTTLVASALLYDVDNHIVLSVPSSALPENAARSRHAAVLGENDKVLIVGGMSLQEDPVDHTLVQGVAVDVQWYDRFSNRAYRVAGSPFKRLDMSLASLQEGRVIAVAGGSDGTTLQDEVAFFSYQEPGGFLKMSKSVRLRETRRRAGVAALGSDDALILIGGYTDLSQITPLASSEIVTAHGSEFSISDGPVIQNGRGDMCMVGLADGRVLVIGGRTVDESSGAPRSDSSVELVVPQPQGSPTVLGKEPMKVGRYHHSCTALADGTVLVLGGLRDEGGRQDPLQDAWIFTPDPIDL